MKYNILIGYCSDGTDREIIIDAEWRNEEIIRTNIQHIIWSFEFYIRCSQINKEPPPWLDMKTYSLWLDLDNGEKLKIPCPWMGNFERLNYAKRVKVFDDMEMKPNWLSECEWLD